jgi:hypothetical protein
METINEEEFWKSIDGCPNYHISNKGNVENIVTGNTLHPVIDTNGYKIVGLQIGKTRKWYRLHRIIALAFIPNPDNKLCVDHVDNDRTNNNVSNLRWVTNQQNDFNRQISSNNTSGVKGVTWHKQKQKWQAQMKINGKSIHIGHYKTLEEAKQARQIKAIELFGEYTNSCEK